jgi:nicotinamide phosphoribosyltransferase
MRLNPLTLIDFYKCHHVFQYPKGTTEVYSNFTARNNKYAKSIFENPGIIFFGLQYYIKRYLIDEWNTNFFNMPWSTVEREISRLYESTIGKIDISHIKNLHKLGYLPVEIKALSEGDLVKIGVPFITIRNTHPEFSWVTNFLETSMSATIWKMITSATTAFEFKCLLTKYAKETGGDLSFIDFQAHDFSFRGMSGVEDAICSGSAHLTSFKGTDTFPSVKLIEDYYCGDSNVGIIGTSIPATEHSVMCAYGKDNEFETYKRLISKIYPSGMVSIVSDSWDYWKVLGEYLQSLKSLILSRDGKVVIRPDSGDPVKIICGDPDSKKIIERTGSVEYLWNVFSGLTTEKGYKLLDNHIGLIYGDSISLGKATSILDNLKNKGFCSTNVVFGIGSYSYQYCTRDNFSLAMKATSIVVNGKRKSIFKDPLTDNFKKKSAKGLLKVQDGILYEDVSEEDEKNGDLYPIFVDGSLVYENSIYSIRRRIDEHVTENS